MTEQQAKRRRRRQRRANIRYLLAILCFAFIADRGLGAALAFSDPALDSSNSVVPPSAAVTVVAAALNAIANAKPSPDISSPSSDPISISAFTSSGTSSGGATISAVPEPTSLSLLALGLLPLLSRRTRPTLHR